MPFLRARPPAAPLSEAAGGAGPGTHSAPREAAPGLAGPAGPVSLSSRRGVAFPAAQPGSEQEPRAPGRVVGSIPAPAAASGSRGDTGRVGATRGACASALAAVSSSARLGPKGEFAAAAPPSRDHLCTSGLASSCCPASCQPRSLRPLTPRPPLPQAGPSRPRHMVGPAPADLAASRGAGRAAGRTDDALFRLEEPEA